MTINRMPLCFETAENGSTAVDASPVKKHGFTLIELLVVIAIIALLVSILLPSLRKAKDLAMAASCLSNVKNTMLGMTFYGEDSDGIVLPGYWNGGQVAIDDVWSTALPAGWFPNYGTWIAAIYPNYCDDAWIMTCPSMRETQDSPSGLPYTGCTYGVTNYGWNSFWKIDDLDTNPGDTMRICDSIYGPVWGEDYESYAVYPALRNNPGGLPRQVPHLRHLDKCNAGFYDGHAEPVNSQFLSDNDWDHWIGWDADDYVFGT